MHDFLLPQLRRRQINMREMWFQDRATAHTTRASMQVDREIFPDHVISCFGDVSQPSLYVTSFYGITLNRKSTFVNDSQSKRVHSRENHSCATINVGECNANFRGEVPPDVCPATGTSSARHNPFVPFKTILLQIIFG